MYKDKYLFLHFYMMIRNCGMIRVILARDMFVESYELHNMVLYVPCKVYLLWSHAIVTYIILH